YTLSLHDALPILVLDEFCEDHLLKEPCRVGDVPSCRRDEFNGLRYVILDLQRLTKLFGLLADCRESGRQVIGRIARTDRIHTSIKPFDGVIWNISAVSAIVKRIA